MPTSIEDLDRELQQYSERLRKVPVEGRVALWEQVDRLLDLRQVIRDRQEAEREVNSA